jgi:hypothetical protein
MSTPKPAVVALTDDPVVADYHATHHRVGFNPPLTPGGQGQGPLHVSLVIKG